MDAGEMWRLAEQRAAHYAPPPKLEPFHAGLIGFGLTGLVLAVFTGFAGMNSDRYALAITATLAIGFFIPFGIYKRQEGAFFRARSNELERLRRGHADGT
jgi:hypothetical protein